MIIRLPFPGPYDWPLALRMISAHAVPGGERLDDGTGGYARVLSSASGPRVVVVRPEGQAMIVEVAGQQVDDGVSARVRHWLDLDLDPSATVARFAADRRLGPLVRERPGLRRIRYPDTFEAVVSTVLGQQVSLAAARTFAGRLAATHGVEVADGLRAFPSAERLAEVPAPTLQTQVGITGSRARTVAAVAQLFAETGDWPVPLPVTEWETRAAGLLALPGIGPWTMGYLRMRLFGDPDAVPVGDLVLRRALGVRSDRDVGPAMEQWRPDRTYATFQLWASTAW